MKKHKKGIKLSRSHTARRALFRSLIRALVEYGSIKTTEAKAKVLKVQIAKLIKLAKDGSVSAKRRVYSSLGNDRKIAEELFHLVKVNFTDKLSGFTKTVKLPERRGDSSRLVRIEWAKSNAVNKEDTKTPPKKKPIKSKKITKDKK